MRKDGSRERKSGSLPLADSFWKLMVSLKLPLAGSKQNFSLGPLGCDEWGGKATTEMAGSKVNEEPYWDIALGVYGE